MGVEKIAYSFFTALRIQLRRICGWRRCRTARDIRDGVLPGFVQPEGFLPETGVIKSGAMNWGGVSPELVGLCANLRAAFQAADGAVATQG